VKTPRAVLESIRDIDPDGISPVPPSRIDYENFERMVVAIYGQKAFNDYRSGWWSKGEGTYE
jgi:hypothetical protein